MLDIMLPSAEGTDIQRAAELGLPECGNELGWKRNDAVACFRLRALNVSLVAAEGGRLRDGDRHGVHIHIVPGQGDDLSPAEPAEQHDQNGNAHSVPLPGTEDQLLLFLSYRQHLRFSTLWDRNMDEYVAEQQVVVHGKIQDR